MALFPTTIGIGYGTSLQPDAGKVRVDSEDGAVVVINRFDNPVYQGEIQIPFATEADRAVIDAFWIANKNLVWTFTHPGDGITYSLYFLNAPQVQRLETRGDVRFSITLSVAGYR